MINMILSLFSRVRRGHLALPGVIATGLLVSSCVQMPDRGNAAGDWNEYSAKFVCGTVLPTTSEGGLLNSGRYFTTVNVHNPELERDVVIWYKVVRAAGANERPLPEPSGFERVVLPADRAFVVDCMTIRERLGATALPALNEGWVVLVSSDEVDVAPVYTAGGLQTLYPVQTIDVERVKRRAIPKPSDEVLERGAIGRVGGCGGGLGCCCNIANASTGQNWPGCAAGFECRGWVDPSVQGRVATCTPATSSPAVFAQLHPSQPPFCGN